MVSQYFFGMLPSPAQNTESCKYYDRQHIKTDKKDNTGDTGLQIILHLKILWLFPDIL